MRAAYQRAAEPLAYESVIEEDQVAWRAAKLYELVVPPAAVSVLGRGAAEGGSDVEPTLALELGELAQLKLAAIAATCRRPAPPARSTTGAPRRATRTWRPALPPRRERRPGAAGGVAAEQSFFDGLA